MDGSVGIVGAGIAGLVLAKELASNGVEVVVYESSGSVGENADRASGILSKTGLDRTGLPYHDSIVNELTGAVFHSKDRSFMVRADSTRAYVLDRIALARSCAHDAVESGARMELGGRLSVQDVRELMGRHRVVVGADGAISTVARSAGLAQIRERVLTYKAVYNGANLADTETAHIYLDNSITPGFFSWAVPYGDGTVEVAVGIEDRNGRNAKEAFDSLVSSGHLRSVLDGAAMEAGKASMIPVAQRGRIVKGNVMLVGDAAGHVKASTGGGIIFGTSCAIVAARAIRAYLSGRGSLSSYESECRRRYGMDLMAHRLIRRFYSRSGSSLMGVTFGMLKAFGTDRVLSAYGDMDSPTTTVKRALSGFAHIGEYGRAYHPGRA